MRRLGVLGLFFMLGCQAAADRKTLADLSEALDQALQQDPAYFGASPFREGRGRLLQGGVQLRLQIQHDPGDHPSLIHVHLLTRSPPHERELDFCISGLDATEVATVVAHHALPPLIAALTHRPGLGAVHFWSDSIWGVPGQLGYVGTSFVRGRGDTSALQQRGIFSNAPSLPKDGRLHVAKAVYSVAQGQWVRTIEFDGSAVAERDQPRGPAENDFGVLIQFAVLEGTIDPLDDPVAKREGRRQLQLAGQWLPEPDVCAADDLPETLSNVGFDSEEAKGGRLLRAVQKCKDGWPESCVGLGHSVVAESATSTLSQSLFIRACHLGSASGCTNAGAGRFAADGCSFRIFEAACDRGADAWGCTMLGQALLTGEGPTQQLARGRQALRQACQLGGPEDPACAAATQLLASAPKASAPGGRAPPGQGLRSVPHEAPADRNSSHLPRRPSR